MAALILALVGAILIMKISAYGIYSTIYPLHKAVKGGIEAVGAQVAEAHEKRLFGGKIPEPTVVI